MVIDMMSQTDNASILTFVAYAIKVCPNGINENTIDICLNVYNTYFESEVENALEIHTKINADLLIVNEEEEQMFFDIID
jgi:hypothetical protein